MNIFKKINFDKLIIGLLLIAIAISIFFELSNHQAEKLFSGFSSNDYENTEILYFNSEEDILTIDQIIEEKSWSNSLIKNEQSKYWIKINFNGLSKLEGSIIHFDDFRVTIEDAFILSNKHFSRLNKNKNLSYSYIEVPKGSNSLDTVYIKIHSTVNFKSYVSDKNYFYSTINTRFIYRSSCISIILFICIINLLLFFTYRDKKYLVHFIFLFTLNNLLFLISGVQSSITGYHDYNHVYLWALLSITSSVYFVYFYFEINKKKALVGYVFKSIIIISIYLLISGILVHKNISEANIWLYFILICFLGFYSSLNYYKTSSSLSQMYIISMIVLSISWGLCTLNYYKIIQSNFITTDLVYIASVIESYIFSTGIFKNIKLEKEKLESLEKEVIMDTMTGLYNRMYFNKLVIPSIIENEAINKYSSLMVIDIDFFKKVNDKFGHDVGDSVLIELAGLLKFSTRKNDSVIRWGGEEFIIVLPDTELNEALKIAESIRQKVELHKFKIVEKINISIGVSQKISTDTIDSWIKKADTALYKAKNNGRNRVEACYKDIIPFKIGWSEIFECNNLEINREHKKLIILMEDFMHGYFSNSSKEELLKIFDEILTHTGTHFTHEENILENINYPYLEKHKDIHNEIVLKALEYRNLYESNKLESLKIIEFLIGEVVMGHMISEDTNYYNYLKS